MRRLACALAVVVASLAVGSAAFQQQPLRVGTNFVRVDVYPTKDGKIVDGLRAEDFEVLEDGTPQKVESFEHVIATLGPQTSRTEPNSQRDMARALANPRARLFLIFLDGPNVRELDSLAINKHLITFLTTALADDDLVAVMTPGMSVRQLTFGRRTDVLEGALKVTWDWGRRDRLDPELDRRRIQYGFCYPGSDVGAKMAARSAERLTLEALRDAVVYLGGIREERKAIVTVTEGWPLYREDPDLMRTRESEAPMGVDKVRVGPTGRLTLENHRDTVNALPPTECDADRAHLAQIDDEKFLREIIDDANRSNATFYAIDPSGLTVRGADHSGALRTLAESTDGAAMLNSNDLSRGFKRISDDMSSYYLLGYYASNSRPDGRFRTITVRTKQPGVQIRARKGYRAPTADEITAARREATPAPRPAGETRAQGAIDQLNRIRPDARFRVNAIATPGPRPSLWVAGELMSTGARPNAFMQGARASIEASVNGRTATGSATLKPGELTFLVQIDTAPLELAAAAGEIDVRVRLSAIEDSAAPLMESTRAALGAPQPQPLLFHRGVTTGNRLMPAADPKFSRTERARLEFAVGPGPQDGTPLRGRVLDRNGLATQVPVTVAMRTDETSGQRWITADVTLAPLSPGDYIVEVTIQKGAAEDNVLTAIRVAR